MNKFIFIALSLLTLSVPVRAAVEPPKNVTIVRVDDSVEKRAAVLELLEVNNTKATVAQSLAGMLDLLESQLSTTAFDRQVFAELKKEMTADDMIALIVPVWEKNFSLAEIRGLTEFYRTPLGQKMIAATPVVMKETMVLGSSYGQEKYSAVVSKLKKN